MRNSTRFVVLAGFLMLTASVALAQNNGFTITTLLHSGDPVAGGGGFSFCGQCDGSLGGEHALNDSGQFVVAGFLSNRCSEAIYLASNRAGADIADFCQPTQFGRLAGFFGANLNNNGEVAMNMGPVVNNALIDMILLFANGQLIKAASEGDVAPDSQGAIFEAFSAPIINNNGDVAFTALLQTARGGLAGDGIYVFSDGGVRKVAVSGDTSPLGGTLSFSSGNVLPSWLNDRGDVLFQAGEIDSVSGSPERFGLFLASADGTIRKVELGLDLLPSGVVAADLSVGSGALNNNGDVAFEVKLAGKAKSGIFLFSNGTVTTVVLHGRPTPIGGTISFLEGLGVDPVPLINDNGAIAFESQVAGGSSNGAIFLASPKAMLKVVALGDRLPTGEKIRGISRFSLNNHGQIAFFVNRTDGAFNPVGVYLATPIPPTISFAKVKNKSGGPLLIVDGSSLITNDATIQINGQSIETEYPSSFQQSGGTTTRLTSRDPNLSQLLKRGQAVKITVVNSLTARTSAPFEFTP